MALSSDLVSQFVKVTNDKTEIKTETTVNGTIVEYEGKKYVRIDGSDLLTPYETTTDVENGERVKVMIKNHTATVTGNVSSPSARTDTVKEVGEKADEASSKISEFEIIIADKVSVGELDAVNGRIDNLVSDNVTIRGELDAHKATIDTLTADNVTINESLTAQSATIENLKTTKLDAEVADITYATITNLDATNATIHNLEATYGDFQVLTTDKFAAIDADIKNLETEKLSAESADLKYANIDFANIGEAAIENFYAKSGVIQDVVISEGQVTGTLVGVTIKGDLIEGGTIVADKLVIQGEDGLYYKLNTNGETVTSQQTEYNSLSGTIITAKSVTAEKIAVDDLVAFDATIGGFNITDHAIYSGVKESVGNTTRGIYLDNYGQIAFGDASNYVKFYKGDDDQYHLAIAAEDMVISSSKKNVADEINEAQKKADAAITKSVDEFYQSTSPTELIGGSWSLVQPTWTEGTYIWRRTKNTYGSGKIEYSPSETGVCITGNTGAQGDPGKPGQDGKDGTGVTILGSYDTEEELNTAHPTGNEGDSYIIAGDLYVWDAENSKWKNVGQIQGPAGKGVQTVTNYYLASVNASGITSSTSGWTTDIQNVTPTKKYLWNYETTTYTDGSTASTAPCVIGVYGDTGEAGSDGKGISSITEYYQVSTSNSTAPTSWQTSVPELTPTNKYLWNYETITYTDGTTKDTAKRVIGVYGDTGAAGKGITKSEVFYYLSTSNLELSGGSWSTSVPDWVDGGYYWQKIKTTYSDNTSAESTPVCITGGKGETGNVGTSVESITTEFYLSDSKTTQTGGSWVTTMPTWSSGKYLWTRNKIVYSNPSSTDYTEPICDSSWEAVNEIQIGGRNYVRNSKNLSSFQLESGDHITAEVSDESITITRVDSGSWYGIYYDLDILPDTEYTFSFEVLSTTGRCYCDIGKGASFTTTIGRIIFSDAGKKSITFTTPSDITAIRLYISMPDQDVVAVICNAKLELGNVATDWTPAPEDIDQKIEDTETNLHAIITEQETTISKNNEEILLQALTGYVGQDEFGEYKETVSSQFSQTSEEIEMKFTDVRSDVQETADGLENVNADLAKYFTFTGNGLTIKSGEGEMQLRLDNDIIRFFKNGKEFGWWDGVNFHTGNIYVDVYERAQFGNFAFVPRSDGSLSFLKVDSYAPPVITKQPVGTTVKSGRTATFTVEAKGSIVSYQWQIRANGKPEWSDSAAESAKTSTYDYETTAYAYVISPILVRCRLTDSKGTIVYTDEVTFTVTK